MNTPDPSTTDKTNTTAAKHVFTELNALQDQRTALYAIRPPNDAEQAARAARLSLLAAREAGWWRVLARTAVHDGLHLVYLRAVIIAAQHCRDEARFWCVLAADWSARADGRPTSDAAGGLSNWHELGVTA